MPRPTHRLTQSPQFSKNPETDRVIEGTTNCDLNHIEVCKRRAPERLSTFPWPHPHAAHLHQSHRRRESQVDVISDTLGKNYAAILLLRLN
jgi:hypothetical protein